MDDYEIRQEILTKLTVKLWPVAGRALGLGKSSSYEGVKSGAIPTIGVNGKHMVPTAFLRRKLGLDEPRT
jgi:hypothetical protein